MDSIEKIIKELAIVQAAVERGYQIRYDKSTHIYNAINLIRSLDAELKELKKFREWKIKNMMWNEKKNQRRCDLIDKEIDGTLTTVESIELEKLQNEMLEYREKVAPRSSEDLKQLREKLEKLTPSKAELEKIARDNPPPPEYFEGDEPCPFEPGEFHE